ncbi:penicillin acylase family protein [Nocardioides pacificus]
MTEQSAAPGSLSEDTSRPEAPVRWWRALRGWPAAARWAVWVSLALVILLLATLATGATLVRRPFPQTTGELDLPGLSAPVEVVRDEYGVPQLYGDSMSDLLRAQGYVQAQERFFEMDVRRHLTAGRLSELFGEAGLESDKFTRTMGWRRVAEQELALVEPATRAALTSYADGVNAYLEGRGTSEIAVEYTMLRLDGLDYAPEPWTPVDSLAWLKAMAWDLRGNMGDEIARTLLAVDHTPEQVAELYPDYPYDEHAPIVGSGRVVDGVFEPDAEEGGTRKPQRPSFLAPTPQGAAQRRALAGLQQRLDDLPALLGRGDGLGSNSWVVDGAHSATGEPLLANDPHLGVGMPGVWMQMGLHCRDVSASCPLDVAGFTFSGVPGVVIGHNADIAWGFTNLGPDVTDLYLERLQGERWRYAGRWRPMDIRTETIRVRDGDDVELTVRETDHGPLLSDVSSELSTVGANAQAGGRWADDEDEEGDGYAVSLAWTALEPSTTADAILALNTASDWTEFRAAAADFAVPAQNLVYADRDGHIGYQAPGRIPIRKSGNDGTLPSEGWKPENDWTGDYIPSDALPSVLDPEEGFIAAANQAVVGEDYPFHLTDDWDRGYRAQRIRDVLEAEGELSVDEMLDLQLDDHNPMAPILVPRLLDVGLPRGYYGAGQRLLETWDFTQPADSAAAAYYNVVWDNVLELTFHDELRESLWPDGGQRWFAVMERLLEEPRNAWWDDRGTDDVVETRDDILTAALIAARDELTRSQAVDPDEWEWGRLHTLDLRSQTLGSSGNPLAEWLVNRDGYRVGGGSSLVDATAWDAAEGYTVTSAPSMRMVVSMADLDDSRWINLTGVSGHPFHDHYTDQTELWVDGETLAWPFSRGAVADAGEDRLLLVPGEEED